MVGQTYSGILEILAHVCLKCMSRFVRQNVHIAGCTVEIGEDEWGLILRYPGAVAAAGFTGTVFEVHQTLVEHPIDEFPSFLREGVVHACAFLDNVFCATFRLRITAFKTEGQVVIIETFQIQADSLIFPKGVGNRDACFQDGFAIISDHMRIVVEPGHPKIGKRNEVFKAQFDGHPVPDMNKAIVNRIQSFAVLPEKTEIGFR